MQNKCYYCGTKLVKFHSCRKTPTNPPNGLTKDHLLPKFRGGEGIANNQVECCCSCNNDKAALTLEEYRLVVAFRKGMIGQVEYQFPGEKC
jgi:hypothetical protein